jgi:preprotein translocase subunit SecG
MAMTQQTNAIYAKESSMLNSTVIKRFHFILTLLLLVIIIFLVIGNENPHSNDVLKRSQKINQSFWLYMTEYNAGGATVPVVYRYYLTSEITGDDQQILKKLKTLEPLIEGVGSIHSINIASDGNVTFGWSGKIVAVSNKVGKADFEFEQ